MPKTCAKCRSPYWNEPRGGISPTVTTLIEKTPEIKKNSAASPTTERSYTERAQLPLEHPEHPLNEEPWVARIPTDYLRHQMTGEEPPKTGPHAGRTKEERLAMIENLKPIVDKENYKKESVLPDYGKQPVVEDQPSYDDYGPVIS